MSRSQAFATVLTPEPPDAWRPSAAGRQCRALVRRTDRRGARGCRMPASVEAWRGYQRPSWWPYCPEHSYGRVALEDGIFYAYDPDPDILPCIVGESNVP